MVIRCSEMPPTVIPITLSPTINSTFVLYLALSDFVVAHNVVELTMAVSGRFGVVRCIFIAQRFKCKYSRTANVGVSVQSSWPIGLSS